MDYNEFTSPTSKMKLLNDRWQEIQHEIDREKQHRQQNIQDQLKGLEDKLSHYKPYHQQKITLLKEHIERIKTKINTQKEHKRQIENNLSKQLRTLQESFSIQIQNQKNQRREQMESWIKDSDQRLLTVCHSMEAITNQNGDTVEVIAERMEKKINQLEETITNQKKRRQQNSVQVTEAIEKQLNRLHTNLQTQRKTRQGTNKKIMQMVQEMQKKLEVELEQQRKARQQTNSALLLLLQETCNKVQKAFY